MKNNKNYQIKKKFFILSMLFLNITFSNEHENNNKENTEQIINAQADFITAQQELLFFFQKTIHFLQTNNIGQQEIESIYIDFLNNNSEFPAILQKLFSMTQDNTTNLNKSEFKLIFKFIFILISKVNEIKSLNLSIKKIDFDSINTDELLIKEFLNFKNSLESINNTEIIEEKYSKQDVSIVDEKTFDILTDLMSRTITIIKKIIDNINNKNYNKSLFKKITTINFDSKEELAFINQYQQQLLQFAEECLQIIQENIFTLTTMRTNFSDISLEKQHDAIIEILEKSIHIISFINHGISKKFLPDKNDINEFIDLEKKLKNKKIKKSEFEKTFRKKQELFTNLQNKILNAIKEKSKELQSLLTKNNNKENSINKKISLLVTTVQELATKEQNLCFYTFQNMYRFSYLGMQNLFEKNKFTKSIKYVLASPVKLFSIYFAWDMYKFLNPQNTPESSYLSMLFTRIVEIYKDLNNINPMNEMTPALSIQKFKSLRDEYLFGAQQEENDAYHKKIALLDSINKDLNNDISAENRNHLFNTKAELERDIQKHEQKLKNITSTNNYDEINANMQEIINTINKDNDKFQEELLKGKYQNYDKVAKNSYKNNTTSKELKNLALLEKKYLDSYLLKVNKKNIEELTDKEKETIKTRAKQSQEIVGAWKEMNYKHSKLVHSYLNPYPFRTIGKNIDQIGRFALPVTAGIFGVVVNNYVHKLESLLSGPKKLLQNFHLALMGEKFETDEKIKLIQEEDFKYSLYDKTFDVWRAQGLLDWFDAVIKEVKKVYSESNATLSPELDRAILVIGESGSGKTTLVNAWLKSLSQEANQSGKLEVEFFQIDPKMFTKEIPTENGRYEKVDIFSDCKGYLKSIKFNNKVVVIHIDEAHLLLGTNEGTFSLTRWADLLNFVTSLNDEQRKNKSRGAMFVIASTNRPDILPPEILKNPNRFSNIIEIPVPSFSDRISILKGYLTNLGMQTSHIDFEYLSGLFEGTNQSYGNVLRIVQKAVVFAKINNTLVSTDIMYKFVNELIRNITFNTNKLDPYCLDQISSYYSATAATAIHFEKIQNLYMFDMATIYPIKNEIESKNISQLYVYPKAKPIQFGEIFYCKRSFQIDEYSKKTLILNLIANLTGLTYCEVIDCGYPKQAQKKLAIAYEMIYEFFASSRPEYAHIALQLDTMKKKQQNDTLENANHFLDIGLSKKATEILKKIELEIKKFISSNDMKMLIEKIKTILNDKKIITRKDILENQEINDLVEKTNKQFNDLYVAIKNILV